MTGSTAWSFWSDMTKYFVCCECGRSCDGDLGFCPYCGSTEGYFMESETVPGVMSPEVQAEMGRVMFATMLALLPGLFDIYGLGHLVLRRYVRAGVFLACTAVLLYAKYVQDIPFVNEYMAYISIGIFIIHALDVYLIVNRKIKEMNFS